jgi:hypothetical protein
METGVFSMWSVPRSCLEDNWGVPISHRLSCTRVEAGSNTSTVTRRVVGGDEKGNLKSETVKYGHESQGTRTRERLRWRGQQHIQKTDPSSSQRGCQRKTRPYLSKSNKYLVMSPRWGSTPRLTDWLTVSCNMTLTFSQLVTRYQFKVRLWRED